MINEDFFPLGKTYLESNAKGLWDGALKAETHNRLCELFVAKRLGIDTLSVASYLQVDGEYLVSLVRKATLDLTDYLDEVIDFPLEKAPNYKKLTPRFVGKFLQLANDWFDDQTGLLSENEVVLLLERVTVNRLGYAMPALESYGFEFVDGLGDGANTKATAFLTMKSLLGQVVTVKPNQYYGCSYTIDKGIENKTK